MEREKQQFNNDNFVLYAPDSLNYITSDLESILNNSLEFYKTLFDVDNFRKVEINYFDDINKYRNFVIGIRKLDNLPAYAKGSIDNGMINAYVENNIIKSSPLYEHRKYMASHELFHVMYQELIWNNNYPRVTWFDEGMAQYFSGEMNHILNDKFDEWFKRLLDKTKVIPNLNEIDHNSSFETENYSGYRLSLLAVKYLVDNLSMDEFKSLMHDYNKIINIGNDIAEISLNYYKNSDKLRVK